MVILLYIEDLLCASPFHSLHPHNNPAKVGVHRKITANPSAQRFRDHLGVASGAAHRRPHEETCFIFPTTVAPGLAAPESKPIPQGY